MRLFPLLTFGLAEATVKIVMEGVTIPGIIKDTTKVAANGLASSVVAGVDNSAASGGGPETRSLDLLKRQTCPPGFPHPCPPARCCQAGYPVCCSTGCCSSSYPVCCSNGGCCPNTYPVCQPNNVCCPTGTTACGVEDPLFCHFPGTQCCGFGVACPSVGAECCGLDCCSTLDGDKCCPGSTPDKSTCCGEYEVCCDGWCCYEGSTCSSTPGYCTVPQLILGYVPGGLSADLVENVCLGIRGQIAMGRPYTTPNTQIVTYAGPNSNNREQTDCKSSRRPRCCENRTVPIGEPGEGDAMSCDEYPFNSAQEGGPGAHVACVNAHANSGGGDLLTSLLSGKHAGFKFQVAVVNIDCNTVSESDVHACNPIV